MEVISLTYPLHSDFVRQLVYALNVDHTRYPLPPLLDLFLSPKFCYCLLFICLGVGQRWKFLLEYMELSK